MAAALSRVYAGLCRRDRLTSKECPFWLDSLFCGSRLQYIFSIYNDKRVLLIGVPLLCLFNIFTFDSIGNNSLATPP
jgi:hypothetical protein